MDTKEHIKLSALKLFGIYGFNGTTTRAIAEHSGSNIGSIKYYFNDKEGLYREVYQTYVNIPDIAIKDEDSVLEGFKKIQDGIWTHLRNSEYLEDCLRLHMQENINPQGYWQNDIDTKILPTHRYMIHKMQCEQPSLTHEDAVFIFYSCLSILMSLHFHKDTMTRHGTIHLEVWLKKAFNMVENVWGNAV